jgi:hypothetical protein
MQQPPQQPQPQQQPPQQQNFNQRQTFTELPTANGTAVEGLNQVAMRGIIAYQDLNYTKNNIPRCTGRLYVPTNAQDGSRKLIGYPVQAWREKAEALAQVQPGTPIEIRGAINIFSWRTRDTNQYRQIVDVRIEDFVPLA